MTEQTPETPKAASPKAASAKAESAEAAPKDAPPKDAPKEQAEPRRAGPPVETATEVLNEAGQATAGALQRIAAGEVLASGGREDIPWIKVRPEDLLETVARCKADSELAMDMLHCLFAVDYVEHIEVVYILFSIQTGRKGMVKVDLPPEAPRVQTVTGLWEAASWYEREAHDLFGVEFEGNDDMEPLLLFAGFEGHPGLKSFPLHDYEEW
ncbi:MAG: NADH-quinone oxidoreductase subunit C [Dehalococcoidia bacterium]